MRHHRIAEDRPLEMWSGLKRHGAMLGLVAAAALMAGCGYPNDWKHGYQGGERYAQAESPAGHPAAGIVSLP